MRRQLSVDSLLESSIYSENSIPDPSPSKQNELRYISKSRQHQFNSSPQSVAIIKENAQDKLNAMAETLDIKKDYENYGPTANEHRG